MKDMNTIVRNILRTRINHKDKGYLDEDDLSDYCYQRGLNYWLVHEELVRRGFDLV